MKPKTSKEFKVSGRLLQATTSNLPGWLMFLHPAGFVVESSTRFWVSQILQIWKLQTTSGVTAHV